MIFITIAFIIIWVASIVTSIIYLIWYDRFLEINDIKNIKLELDLLNEEEYGLIDFSNLQINRGDVVNAFIQEYIRI